MDKLEEEEMTNSRPVEKNNLNEWYEWLIAYVPKLNKSKAIKAFSKAKSGILYNGAKKKLKDAVEEEAKKEN